MTRKLNLNIALVLLLATAPVFAAEGGATPAEYIFASPDGVDLKAYVVRPEIEDSESPRPAVVIFHGGGWTIGSPEWGISLAKHYADLGMVGISAQYRLSGQPRVTPLEAIEDAKAAIRWTRANSRMLEVDPDRVAAYGWSAGAHLAVCAAIFDESASDDVSGAPNLLLLKSPAVSIAESRWVQGLLGEHASAAEISPDLLVRKGLPPAFIVQGRTDTVTPTPGVERFCDRMREAGNSCELLIYEGVGHLFTPSSEPDYEWPNPDPEVRAKAGREIDRFLIKHNYLEKTALDSAKGE